MNEVMTESFVLRAMARPSLREKIVNAGTMSLYCDYAGFAARNAYGVACCTVYNRTVLVSMKPLMLERDPGSNYGEMMAIGLSLDAVSAALTDADTRPSFAIVYSDCSRISRLLAQSYFADSHVEQARDEVIAKLTVLHRQFPEVNVQIRYIGRHKKNNEFHRLAHNAARGAALRSE